MHRKSSSSHIKPRRPSPPISSLPLAERIDRIHGQVMMLAHIEHCDAPEVLRRFRDELQELFQLPAPVPAIRESFREVWETITPSISHNARFELMDQEAKACYAYHFRDVTTEGINWLIKQLELH